MERGILRGVSLDPPTPVDVLEEVADKFDVVVLLAVGPDTGKQEFIDRLPQKIAALKAHRSQYPAFLGATPTRTLEECADRIESFHRW